jgi:hypothetical protein
MPLLDHTRCVSRMPCSFRRPICLYSLPEFWSKIALHFLLLFNRNQWAISPIQYSCGDTGKKTYGTANDSTDDSSPNCVADQRRIFSISVVICLATVVFCNCRFMYFSMFQGRSLNTICRLNIDDPN